MQSQLDLLSGRSHCKSSSFEACFDLDFSSVIIDSSKIRNTPVNARFPPETAYRESPSAHRSLSKPVKTRVNFATDSGLKDIHHKY